MYCIFKRDSVLGLKADQSLCTPCAVHLINLMIIFIVQAIIVIAPITHRLIAHTYSVFHTL